MLRVALCLTIALIVLLPSGLLAAVDDAQILGPGDRVRITVLDEPDVSRDAVLDADGYVSLAMLDRFKLGGMTTVDASVAMESALKTYIVGPKVTIELLEVGKKRVFVVGDVKKPGPLALDPDAKLIEAVTTAELLETADLTKITIRRKSLVQQADLTLYLSGKDLTPNLAIQPGDTIIVPRKDMTQSAQTVLVIGEVNKSGALPLKSGMTIREVIAAAGGITANADTSRITLKHEGDTQGQTIDFSRAQSGDLLANVTIAGGDTLFVPKIDNGYYTIQGAVNAPGQYLVKEGITIEEATAMAGGVSKEARIDDIQVIHTQGGAIRTEKVNLKNIYAGKTQTLVIRAGDRLYVPSRKESKSFLDILTSLAGFGWILAR